MNLIGLVMVSAGSVSWAGDLSDFELEAVAVGDFDCSGSLGQAVLYSDKEGDLVVELTLRVPERELLEPYSSDKGSNLDFGDIDGDRCDDLVISVAGGEPYSVKGIDHAEVVELGQRTAGDSEPDLHIELRSPLTVPSATLNVGPGIFEGWGSWKDECRNTCGSYGPTGFYVCGITEKGEPVLCASGWGCTSWKLYCIIP